MPELPEVETIARQLAPLLTGRRLREVEILDGKLAWPAGGRLIGCVVASVERHGKEVMVRFVRSADESGISPGPASDLVALCVHLRMTGRLIWRPAPSAGKSGTGSAGHPQPLSSTMPPGPAVPVPDFPERPPRARLIFEGGELWFVDVRRFGTLRLVERTDAGAPDDSKRRTLPIDPMSRAFTLRALAGLLAGSRQAIKPWLLRQDRLVGLGNIYASEALHEAGLSPLREGGSLNKNEIRKLHQALRAVLRRAIQHGGTSFSDFQDASGQPGRYQRRLQVYGRAGEPCQRCGAMIKRLVQSSRSTYHCPACQK